MNGREANGREAIGVDIGGTKTAVGLIAADGAMLRRELLDTPARDAEAIVETVGRAVERLLGPKGDRVVPVGVGAAGMIDLDGTIRFAPNLDWNGFPLQNRIRERVGLPTTVLNDANAAAWGEYRLGAGQPAKASMVMLTVGTGVGGGLVNNGDLVHGANGYGAEFGHVVIAEGHGRCNCGNSGCIEALASGTAIATTAVAHREAGRIPASSPLHHEPRLTGRTVTAAAQAGDVAARAVMTECGGWLGVGIAALVNALDPEIVVLGGGVMQAGELILHPAREAAAARIMGRSLRSLPPIVLAELGNDGGMVGAGMFAMEARKHGVSVQR